MLISEVYNCIQGEGLLLGTPSVLVRTSGCNLKCKWGDNLCDTEYTSWHPKDAKKMSPKEIMEVVTKSREGMYIEHIILSGGEPLIQPDYPEVVWEMLEAGFHVTIETNGTKLPGLSSVLHHHSRILFSVSPKLSTSIPTGTEFENTHASERINMAALGNIARNFDFYLKFVVSREADVFEALQVSALTNVSPWKCYLMAEGRTPNQVSENAQWVVEQCKLYGFMYSPREHLTIYGPKRGT